MTVPSPQTAQSPLPRITPVLLCGGSGTRLWPLSRKSYPKQFARLMGDESLFQASARRLSGAGFAAPLILTGEPFRFIVTEQLAATEQAASGILIENNIITHTISGAFHTNVGINLELYNNIFAFNRNFQLTSAYPGAAHQMAIRRNIILADGQKMLNDPWFKMPAKAVAASDNLLWDMKAGNAGGKDKGIAAAVKLMGEGSTYADPKFANPKKDDFTLPADSPAPKIGFVPLDLSGAGPRPRQ
ncbi:hypothetical protein LCGC14_2782070 [marine sediment metagenome]|uniref:Nucleotidyl transferase domain-containing protein n=1 Tax=marine sediment metagenome TaxID=412755 RepID=A0A0F9B1M3_9ZZZZ